MTREALEDTVEAFSLVDYWKKFENFWKIFFSKKLFLSIVWLHKCLKVEMNFQISKIKFFFFKKIFCLEVSSVSMTLDAFQVFQNNIRSRFQMIFEASNKKKFFWKFWNFWPYKDMEWKITLNSELKHPKNFLASNFDFKPPSKNFEKVGG